MKKTHVCVFEYKANTLKVVIKKHFRDMKFYLLFLWKTFSWLN